MARRKKRVEVKPTYAGKIRPKLKHTIRKMIRDAIRWQNKQVLFTCRKCCFYMPENEEPAKCGLDASNQLVLSKRMPTQLPECFTLNPLASALTEVLTTMWSLGIDTTHTEYGWPTVAHRIAQRADKFGYITGITQKNLNKYGS